jgi:hypothetical protein
MALAKEFRRLFVKSLAKTFCSLWSAVPASAAFVGKGVS